MTNDTLNDRTPERDVLTDPRPSLASVLATCADLIDTVTPDQMDRPTPCGDMDVRQMLGHLAMVAQRIDCAARSVPTHEWPSDVTGLADDEWAPAFRSGIDAALAAWDDPALLEQEMVLPWATLQGRDVVGIYTNEVIVHGWDLAQAVGAEPAWGDEAVAVATIAVHDQLPDADRGPLWASVQASMPPGVPWADPFANAVPVADDASAVDRLVAWNGRRPGTAA